MPFYFIWLGYQKPKDEIFLYMVRGKFTYLNVLALISRIEQKTGSHLKFERKKIEAYYNAAKKRKVSFRRYRPTIYRLLKKKAFGDKSFKTAFYRMPLYSKIVAVWDLLIPVSIINLIVVSVTSDEYFIGVVLIAAIFGIMPAALVWFVAHTVFNNILKYITEVKIKKASSIPYRIAMAQYWAFFIGYFWKDVYWVDLKSYSPSGIYYGGFSSGWSSGSGFDGFGGSDFGGGGAGGDW